MHTTLRVTMILLASSVLLAGCLGSGGRSAQREARAQKRPFMPLAGEAGPLASAPRAAAVKMRGFRVQPPFDVRHFIVRRPGGEFAADYYNGWLAAPHELIRVQATRYIEASEAFGQALTQVLEMLTKELLASHPLFVTTQWSQR